MKGTVVKNSCAALLAVAFFVSPADIAEAKSKRKILREFKGWYSARCFGAIGLTTGLFQNVTPVNRAVRSFVGGPNVITVESPSGRIHQLVGGRSRIRAKKIVSRSTYRGTFINPNTAVSETVYGSQNVTIKKKRKRFVMRVGDNLNEGTLSYWRLRCGLTKKRR